MKCMKCGAEVAEGAIFCTTCGAPMSEVAENVEKTVEETPNPQPVNNATDNNYYYQQAPQYQTPVYADPKDHTAEFDAKDISDNKVIAMLPYLMNVVGVIIALLAAKESPYIAFHVRQALKISVTAVLIGIVTLVLCWTIIVPILAGICMLVLLVVNIICFFRVCSGKAIEAPIVSSFGFLK